MSSFCQQSSSSSQNTTIELQDSSITGQTLPDTSITMPPPSTKNGDRNIYGFMVDVSKFTLAQLQQHAIMLLQHYHKLCNMNDPLSIFLSPPPIHNIETLSQSTILSLDSGSFGRHRSDVKIQQQNKSEVSNTETAIADNEELDIPPPQNISNVFAAAGLSYCILFR